MAIFICNKVQDSEMFWSLSVKHQKHVTFSPGANTIKHFSSITDGHNKLERFVPGKPFLPSPLFANKAGTFQLLPSRLSSSFSHKY
jgi:hypothetical protein